MSNKRSTTPKLGALRALGTAGLMASFLSGCLSNAQMTWEGLSSAFEAYINPGAASGLSWSASSPQNNTTFSATWTTASDVSSQSIEYFGDATCGASLGSFGPLSSADQSHGIPYAADGLYTYKISSTDSNGVVTLSSCSASIQVDQTAPASPGALAWSQTSPTRNTSIVATWSVSASSDVAQQAVAIYSDNTCSALSHSSGSLGPAAASYAWSSGEGTFYFKVTAADYAGNTVASPCSSALTVDQTSPALASATVTNSNPTVTTAFSLSYGAVTGTYDDYCILENSTTISGCTWASGALPGAFNVSAANNDKKLSLWIRDTAGNVSSRVDTNTVTLDTSAPTLTSVDITQSSPTNSTTYNLSYVGAAGYSSYCILENDTVVGNCTFTAGTLPSSFTVDNTNEAKVLSVWLRDTAGNTSARVDSDSVTLDNVAPTLASATVTNSDPTTSTTYALTFGALSESPTHYCIRENDTNVANCTFTAGALPASFAVDTTNEAKVLSIWVRDAAGNVSTRVDSNSVTLDTTAPVLASATITNSNPTGSVVYNLSYGAVTGTYSHYCILENSTSVAACTYNSGTLPATYSVTSTDGIKTLSIWLKDSVGNVSARVDTNSVTLDTTGPTLTSVDITNSSPTNSTTYNLSYVGATGYTEYCILENNTSAASCTYTTGTLPASFTVDTANEAKVLSIWLKDSVGNVSTRVDSDSVTFDDVAPSLAGVTIGNTDPTNDPNFSLTYGAVTGAYSEYCILENSTSLGSCSWTTATLPASYTVTNTSGTKTLSFWLRDSAGNVSTRTDSSAINLDVGTVSLASVTVTNTSPTNSTTYNLTYGTASSYDRYCILENNTSEASCTYTTGTLPTTYTVDTTNEAKVLSVWIKNSAGTTSARVDSNSVSFDNVAPTLTSVDITNSSPTNSTTYNLTYAGASGYVKYCILENNTDVSGCSYVTAVLPNSYVVDLTNEAKVLSVWLKDAAGNISSRIDSDSVIFDNIAPTLASATITNSSPTYSTIYNLNYGAIGGSPIEYCILENSTVVDSCSWIGGGLPSSFTVSASDGAKVLSIWTRDTAGNISTRTSTNSVTLETAAPVLASVNITNASPTNTMTYSLSYGAITGSYTNYCILENDQTQANCTFTAGTLPSTFTVDSTNETKTLSVWLKNGAGNVSTRVDSDSVVLDTVAPTVSIISPAAGSLINDASKTSFTLSGACSENGRNIQISGDATASATCAAGAWSVTIDLTSAADGTITLFANHSDLAGNAATQVSRSFVKDTVAPTSVTIGSSSGAISITNNPSTYAVSGSCSENGGYVRAVLNGSEVGSAVTCGSSSYTLNFTTPITDGDYSLAVSLKDSFDNTKISTSVSFKADRVTPTVSFGTPTLSTIDLNTGSSSIEIGFSEQVSGFTASDLVFSHSSGSGCTTKNLSTTDNVTFTLTLSGCSTLGTFNISTAAGSVTDLVGNLSAASGYSENITVQNATGTVPTAPTTLSGVFNSSTSLTLNWADNSSDEDGFKIEESNDGTTFTQIGTSAVNIATYTRTGLTSGTYYYRVRATNASGDSTFTNVLTMVTPTIPTGLPSPFVANAASSTSITLDWIDNSNEETGYIIDRSLDGSSFSQIVLMSANSTTYTDSGLSTGTIYYYRISAYKDYTWNRATAIHASSKPQLGINLQVPIEMTDLGLESQNTSPMIDLRSQTQLETGAYDGRAMYRFSIVAANSSGTTSYPVELMDSADNVKATITVPAATPATLYDVPVNTSPAVVPPAGNYKVRVPQTSANAEIKIYAARILVNQVNATKTRIYYPLFSTDYLSTYGPNMGVSPGTASAAAAAMPESATQKIRPNYLGTTTWSLASIFSANSPTRTAYVTLYNIETGTAVSGSAMSTSNTTPTLLQSSPISPPQSARLEARMNVDSTNAGGNIIVYKSGLWQTITNMTQAEVCYRVSKKIVPGNTSTITNPYHRIIFDGSFFSAPTVTHEVAGTRDVNGSSATLLDHGNNDSGTAGTTNINTGMNLNFGSGMTKDNIRSGPLALTNGNRIISGFQPTISLPQLTQSSVCVISQ